MLPEQAWNHFPKSESDAEYITQEMASAFGACLDSIQRGDFIAARLAFIECYKSEIAKAQFAGKPPKYFFSGATNLHYTARLDLKIEKTMEAAEKKWIAPTKAAAVVNAICAELGKSSTQFLTRLYRLSNEPMPAAIGSPKISNASNDTRAALYLIGSGEKIDPADVRSRLAEIRAKLDGKQPTAFSGESDTS